MQTRRLTDAFLITIALFFAGCSQKQQLEEVAQFGSQQVTGVAVSSDNRIFVNFPRWSENHDISVAEVLADGSWRPYPNEKWNRWQSGQDPKQHFVCVQSVYCDPNDPESPLWVLDAGNPQFAGVVPNAPKLLQIDLASNTLVRTIGFDSEIAPKDSYLNDVRVDARRGFAYITDSGLGALVVVDLNTSRCRRVLEEHPAARAEADLRIQIGGKPWRTPEGQTPAIHADGIALSPDKDFLYFKALTGKTLYRIPTMSLRNFSLPDRLLEKSVESLGETVVSDGMAMDARNNLYLTALEQNAVVKRLSNGKLEPVIVDSRLIWPDSLAISAKGDLYITVSQIHLSPQYHEGQNRRSEPYRLYRLPSPPPPPTINLTGE